MKKFQKTSHELEHIGFYSGGSNLKDPSADQHNEDIFNQLDKALNENNHLQFAKILTETYIYPKELIYIKPEYYYDTRRGRDSNEPTGSGHFKRIETLTIAHLFYFDKQRLFRICQKILESGSPLLYKALFGALKSMDVVPERLFYWDDKVIEKIKKGISGLVDISLHSVGDESHYLHSQLEDLHGQLKTDLNALKVKLDKYKQEFLEGDNAPNESVLRTNLNGLILKLDILNTLDKYNARFAWESNWKKVVANIVSLLFTGGVANIFNKVITGKWSFFDKTESQEKVDEIGHTLKMSSKKT